MDFDPIFGGIWGLGGPKPMQHKHFEGIWGPGPGGDPETENLSKKQAFPLYGEVGGEKRHHLPL